MSASSTSTRFCRPHDRRRRQRGARRHRASQLGGTRRSAISLDLRSNPGGLLDQAVGLSDAFLERGEIVSQRGRRRTDIERFYARAGRLRAKGLPIIVLVDAGTRLGRRDRRRRAAGSSPRDRHGRAQLRQGLGADPDPDRDGSTALRLTTARYYTPSGRSVQEGGIDARHRRAAAVRPGLQLAQPASAKPTFAATWSTRSSCRTR